MLWHTEMACGVHLGILLICLVQAEHVRCLWAAEAPNSQMQNGNRYVGFSQQDSGLRRLGGSYPQNQFRQASLFPGPGQSSSFNPQTAVSSGYNQGLSGSSYTQTVSQPAHSGHSSVRLVQSSSLSKPNFRITNVKQVNAQTVPKRQFPGLSTAIASGSSVSKYSQKQNAAVSKGRTWPVQQGTLRTSQYLSSSSASARSPSRERHSFTSTSYQSAAQKPPSADAKTPVYDGQRGFSPSVTSSSLFAAGAPAPQKPRRTQTSATVRARRVSTNHHTGTVKPPSLSSKQHERAGNDPSQTAAVKPYQSRLFPANGGNAQGSHKRSSNRGSSHVSYTQSLPAAYKQDAPVGFEPRSIKNPTGQKFNYKPSYTSTEKIPSSTSSVQALRNSRTPAQGARNLAAPGSSRTRTSSQRFAPTRTHSIPNHFGGYAIRRLKEPADQKAVGVSRPQTTYTAPPRQTASYKPQGPSVRQERKWRRIRPQQVHN